MVERLSPPRHEKTPHGQWSLFPAENVVRKELQEQRDNLTEARLSELHTVEQAFAFNAGLTEEEYDGVFAKFGNHSGAILELLTFGKAKTPEEARILLLPIIPDLELAEKRIDAVGKAMQKNPLFRHGTVGGRILASDIAHEAWRKKHHIGKGAVHAMFARAQAQGILHIPR